MPWVLLKTSASATVCVVLSHPYLEDTVDKVSYYLMARIVYMHLACCVCHINNKSEFHFSLDFLQNKQIVGFFCRFRLSSLSNILSK